MRYCNEPKLAEILHDSIVIALMQADRVDAKVLAAELRTIGRTISISEGNKVGTRRRDDHEC